VLEHFGVIDDTDLKRPVRIVVLSVSVYLSEILERFLLN